MIKPKRLVWGDTIGVISPSFSLTKRFVHPSIKLLNKLGFNVKLGKHVYSKYGFMAGNDEKRAGDIHAMFKDKQIKAIFCAAGGSGANRLLPLINFDMIKKNPKIFIGMSDITYLTTSIHEKTGLITFHGPNIISGIYHCDFKKHNLKRCANIKYMLEALTNPGYKEKIKDFEVIKKGRGAGRLIGGNLRCLENLNGTKFMPDYKNKILFWEELDEDASEISRMLMNLKLCGVFDKIKGMAIGNLFDCPPYKNMTIKKVVLDITKDYKFPIIYNVDFGHVCKNITLPIGVKAKIDTEKRTFEVMENAVKKINLVCIRTRTH
ncbi:MAG TPA: LD-carboxypeptidase [Candidatus Nanoarchaeia archaeon]|nr:LD-carboxypeptidase [Candidatus Nanoarchaeia archaeon]